MERAFFSPIDQVNEPGQLNNLSNLYETLKRLHVSKESSKFTINLCLALLVNQKSRNINKNFLSLTLM